MAIIVALATIIGCSTKKNTSSTRWWHSFNARYNTYYNGSLAFIDGSQEKENGNHDNFTEMIPMYIVGNKTSREIGKSNFDRAIEKSEKAIKLHSIKRRPIWDKNRRKTAKDIEWLNRREYNPFLWKAWLLMGKSQFQKGEFEEAAATFSYMTHLYSTQPAINGIARAWLVKAYAENDWLYEAEDIINKQRRDSMDYRAVTDWDYAYADFYIRNRQYDKGTVYLRKVIKHERRRKLKARQWYLLGQIYAKLGNNKEAYKAFKRVVRLSPPYELTFNARIAQTEVMAQGRGKQTIRKLKRMAKSDNNKEYLDQVYYAIGNVYMNEKDTTNAILAYEKGAKMSTRGGIEKGTLLLKLGNIYWERERYSDAQRCYGEAIGLLDKDSENYEQLSDRSKVLDELVPHTESIHLQDSLQALANMSEKDRNEAIDRVIKALIEKEKEEKRRAEEAEAEKAAQEQGGKGNLAKTQTKTTTTTTGTQQSSTWYFYNPTAVSQGKAAFQRQWGKRENADNWQRANKTVVALNSMGDNQEEANEETGDNTLQPNEQADSTTTNQGAKEGSDSLASDPHKREYYLAQIPFTDEQKAASNDILKPALYNAGVILKDKMDNLPLSEKYLTRLVNNFADYEQNDEALYHLFLLYSRQGNHAKAAQTLDKMKANYPKSQWTTLLSDPYYAENQRFGVHIEDSLYAATYDAFKASKYGEVVANEKISSERFPQGINRPKFLFVGGLTMLNEGKIDRCLKNMKEVVEKFPESEVSPMAGMIIKGVQQGRRIHGGKFSMDDIWNSRAFSLDGDSTTTDTLSLERNTNYVFVLAFQPDSIDSNKLLFEMAKYNFSNFMVRNFDISTDSQNGIGRMIISGFLSYDEALQYSRQLKADKTMKPTLMQCRSIIVSEDNFKLLGTKYSYSDYEKFFDEELAPIKISNEKLLDNPTDIVTQPSAEDNGEDGNNEDINNNENPPTEEDEGGGFDFDEDFYR